MKTIKKINDELLEESMNVWNEIVLEKNAFPQEECLNLASAKDFFDSQTFSGACVVDGHVAGVYILHPNNVGRCGHICNASYAVSKMFRGQKIGQELVLDCIKKAKEVGYKILQFNAVVATNVPALNLYKKLGFIKLGVIKNGFKLDDGTYLDIIPHYIEL